MLKKRLSGLVSLALAAMLVLGCTTALAGGGTGVDIKAVAAGVLGVEAETLAGLNNADELYAALSEADAVEAFKTALIAAKAEQYANADASKFEAGELDSKLAGYTQVINDWDGSTELVVSSNGAGAKAGEKTGEKSGEKTGEKKDK